MKKFVIGSLLLISHFLCHSQDIPTPSQFLGYPLGSQFTPYFKIVNYFNQIAKSDSQCVMVDHYGQTSEGRPLLLAYITCADNKKRLDEIRKNNLRLCGIITDNAKLDNASPAIVWLSYNVHGNEPASSEAAMKTLYELINPMNHQSKEWLKKVIVIIDPCINPDGRERYIEWYRTAMGQTPDTDPLASEHHEPWPGGRTNHYQFDLNRDWAWQTQMETKQRMKMYNQWLPQVHVDFHEQGYNEPYYFAPAAEPYHEVITPWQREFQVMIGKNNAKAFDEHGWLYFTKQTFDLFYPSYGDTYPMYNGAIGMTFEQGGIGAGLSIRNEDGDTLSLLDRLEHHFTTGMQTIQLCSLNADRLVKEFQLYFKNEISNPTGDYKAYIVQSDGEGGKLTKMKELLETNLIHWNFLPEGNYLGYDYQTGMTSRFKATKGDIFINSNQPKSNLIRVLFERNAKISDSATYDITAWSVPFAYGLKTMGMMTFLHSDSTINISAILKQTDSLAYGFVVRWEGMNSARFLALLLRKGIKIRRAEQPFTSANQAYEKGTLIIAHTSNANFEGGFVKTIKMAASKFGISAIAVSSGFVDKGFDFGSDRVRLLHAPRVVLLTGNGVNSQAAGEIWHFFEQELEYPITRVNADDLIYMSWKKWDILILPDGGYKFLSDRGIVDQLKNWIHEGGKLIALENAVLQLSKADFGIRQKNPIDDKKDGIKDKTSDYAAIHRYENRERDLIVNTVPGSIYKVDIDNSHPLAFGYPDYYYTLKQDSNVYEYLRDGGWNVGIFKKEGYVSGFTGSKVREKLKDGVIFGVQSMGSGQIVYLADNPLFRDFWENGKLLFCNAVFQVGQ